MSAMDSGRPYLLLFRQGSRKIVDIVLDPGDWKTAYVVGDEGGRLLESVSHDRWWQNWSPGKFNLTDTRLRTVELWI